MTQRVLRYQIPVDDKVHELNLNGPLLHVDSRGHDYVELWTMDTGKPPHTRRFRVYGTGHDIQETGVEYVGSAIVGGGLLVWHLFEVGW